MRSKTDVHNEFQSLAGLQLAIARDAADMKVFHFGRITPHNSGKGSVGQYALHLSCPWRITGPLGIITGSSDRYQSSTPEKVINEEDWSGGNVQSKKLSELLGSLDPETRSIINTGPFLIVQAANSDENGEIKLALSEGYSLEFFPDSSSQEAWRLFVPGDTTSHFIFPEELP